MTYGRMDLPKPNERIHGDTSLLNVRMWVEAHDPDTSLLVNMPDEASLTRAKRTLDRRIDRFTAFINYQFGHSHTPAYWGKAWLAFKAADLDVMTLLGDD